MKKSNLLLITPFIFTSFMTSCVNPISSSIISSSNTSQVTNSTSSSSSSNSSSSEKIENIIERNTSFVQENNSLNLNISFNNLDNYLSDITLNVKNFSEEVINSLDKVSKVNLLAFPRHGKYKIDISYKNNLIFTKEITIYTDEINVAYLRATAPVSIFTYLALQNQNTQTYFDLSRGNTYKYDYLPETWHLIPNIRENYNKDDFNSFQNIDFTITRNFLKSIINELPNIKVNFYICDVENNDIILDLYKLLPEEQFTINLLTDGTLTSIAISNNNDTYEKYSTYLNEVNNILANKNEYQNFINSERLFALASIKDNVNFYVYDKNTPLQNAKDEKIKAIIDKTLTKLSYIEMYETFKTNQELCTDFEYIFGTRWKNEDIEESVNDLFISSNKPNLIILGTSPTGENNYNYTFEQSMNYVINNYKNDFDIFYKGHPAYPSNEERKQYFETNNIIELPGSTPAEIMLTFYPDVFTGGYLSSTFLSAKEDQIKCVFSTKDDFNNNKTYDGVRDLFTNTIFVFDEIVK